MVSVALQGSQHCWVAHWGLQLVREGHCWQHVSLKQREALPRGNVTVPPSGGEVNNQTPIKVFPLVTKWLSREDDAIPQTTTDTGMLLCVNYVPVLVCGLPLKTRA